MAKQEVPMFTVFGGGGFIGRYVCEALLKSGVRLRVAQRDPRRAFFIQPLGQVGQVGFVKADMARPESIARAVEGATGVVNLVGIFDGPLQTVHVDGPRAAASAAREAGAASFVHVSAIGADPSAASEYGSSKGRGEEAVRAAFPDATIVRPSVVFGPEDDFTNRFASLARLPVLPVIAPNTRFQPVFARDLGKAIAEAALNPQRHGGKTYELGGPEVLTMREINAQIAEMAGQRPSMVDLPGFVSGAIASFGFLPGAPLSRDQWAMLQHDNVVSDGASGFESFGIDPAPMSAVAPSWLGRFVRGGRFAPKATQSGETAA